ncbi:MAG: translation initiation factor 6, partial [Nitrososphaerota archaeon]
VGGVIHPNASEEEVKRVQEVLKVDVEPATVNGGVPFVASGIVVNSQAAIVGSLTRGPELAILTRAFQV